MHRNKILCAAGALLLTFASAHVVMTVTGKCPLGCLMENLHGAKQTQTPAATN